MVVKTILTNVTVITVRNLKFITKIYVNKFLFIAVPAGGEDPPVPPGQPRKVYTRNQGCNRLHSHIDYGEGGGAGANLPPTPPQGGPMPHPPPPPPLPPLLLPLPPTPPTSGGDDDDDADSDDDFDSTFVATTTNNTGKLSSCSWDSWAIRGFLRGNDNRLAEHD